MSDISCSNEDCTVAQTGLCVLNNVVAECPNRIGDIDEEDTGAVDDPALGDPVLDAPTKARRFSPSAALGTLDANAMMRRRPGKIIGILGAPDSGKTASLVSLYLLLSHGRLEGFSFANSRSLLVFEDLARGARSWNAGEQPEQMTVHTELDAGRSAGFLHLKVRRETDRAAFDLFVPDLPGEWSTSLIDSNRTDRLDFLRGAHAIWVMVDGASIVAPDRKMNAIHRVKRLIGRLATMCGDAVPAIHLVVSRLDQVTPDTDTLDQIVKDAAKFGVDLKVHHIASFTDGNSQVRAGTGLSELMDATLAFEGTILPIWPKSNDYGPRQCLRISEEAAE